jgi:hypothetical protein
LGALVMHPMKGKKKGKDFNIVCAGHDKGRQEK